MCKYLFYMYLHIIDYFRLIEKAVKKSPLLITARDFSADDVTNVKAFSNSRLSVNIHASAGSCINLSSDGLHRVHGFSDCRIKELT